MALPHFKFLEHFSLIIAHAWQIKFGEAVIGILVTVKAKMAMLRLNEI